MNRQLPFVVAATVAATMGLYARTSTMAEAKKPAEKPLIEVRESGAYAPQPHPAVIQIFADGRVKKLSRERRVKPEEVKSLLKRLEKLGAFKLDQKTLDRQFAEAGEVGASERGGSGFVTLLFPNQRPPVQVSLNRPDQFAKSKAASVRTFVATLHLIRDFVDPPPKKTANQPRTTK
jgi:hypothetical protein